MNTRPHHHKLSHWAKAALALLITMVVWLAINWVLQAMGLTKTLGGGIVVPPIF
jgi:hypothetical protein